VINLGLFVQLHRPINRVFIGLCAVVSDPSVQVRNKAPRGLRVCK